MEHWTDDIGTLCPDKLVHRVKVFENYVIRSTVHSQQKSVFKKKSYPFIKNMDSDQGYRSIGRVLV